MNIAKASGQNTNPEIQTPLAADSSLELYGILVLLVISAVAVWELVKSCWRNHGEAARLRALQSDQRLSKKEMRELNGLLQRDPRDLRSQEKERMIQLAETAGVDLSGILGRKTDSSSSTTSGRNGGGSEATVPPPPDPYSASAADEEFLRRRRREAGLRQMPPTASTIYLRGPCRGGRQT